MGLFFIASLYFLYSIDSTAANSVVSRHGNASVGIKNCLIKSKCINGIGWVNPKSKSAYVL
jgi:hypothetical protein